VIVLPHEALVQRGPYRFMHHPNYVAVVVEGVALPMVHTAWLTAVCFTLANAALLTVRLRVENSVLGYA
jgi:methyltransferase